MVFYVAVDEEGATKTELFAERQDAEAFIEAVRQDDPELAEDLRVEKFEFPGGHWPRKNAALGNGCNG